MAEKGSGMGLTGVMNAKVYVIDKIVEAVSLSNVGNLVNSVESRSKGRDQEDKMVISKSLLSEYLERVPLEEQYIFADL